jgi:transcriptional regulator with XRE-family HTH domain
MDLGHRVRDLRNAQHLSQIELAARAGVARNTLNRIENGHLMPTAPVIEHLAEALNVAPGVLFEEPVPLDEAPREAGPADDRKGPDPEEWGADEDRPKPPMPESAGKRIHVQIEGGQVTITETAFLDLIRAARAGRLTDEDARQRLLDESA